MIENGVNPEALAVRLSRSPSCSWHIDANTAAGSYQGAEEGK